MSGRMAGTGHAYTYDGKRKSSQTHARRSWTCDCGRKVWGNGGKSSHQRACRVWAEAELARVEHSLERYLPGGESAHLSIATEFAAKYEAKRDALRERLNIQKGEAPDAEHH